MPKFSSSAPTKKPAARKTKQRPLQAEPSDAPGSSLHALAVNTAQLTPEQQRFNRLLTRVETLTAKIGATRALADAHRPLRASTLQPLEQRCQALMREMVLKLDERLQRKGLTQAHKSIAIDILCGLSETLAMKGDAAMRVLHDQYSDDSLSDKERTEAKHLHAMMSEMGAELDEIDEDQSLEDFLHASMAKMQAHMQAEQDQRQAQQPPPKSGKPKTAKQNQAEQKQEDAQAALRTIYRQLASALHPDREQDPQEHARKSALMSEANAAYERRDLMALLALQLRIEQIDPAAIARMTHEKMQALTLLLKEQAKALDQDLHALQHRMREEFEVQSYSPITAAMLRRDLAGQAQVLQNTIMMMKSDLQRVENDAQFKRWLKEQQLQGERQHMEEFLFGENHFFD